VITKQPPLSSPSLFASPKREDAARRIAFFDFDDTLVKGDSLWPFLLSAAGAWTCLRAALLGGLAWIAASLRKDMDRRTIVKKILLKETLGGRSIEDLHKATAGMRDWAHWKAESMDALRAHAAAGDHIVIATGSLALYIPAMLEGIPYHALIATEMEVENGRLTGRMLPSGNCVRNVKAARVAAYLETFGPAESWAYGNAPHDLPMMAVTTHGRVIA